MGLPDLIRTPAASEIKSAILAICNSAGLRATAWVLGRPSERWVEVIARALSAFESRVTAQYVRGWFLQFATDPGDPGDLAVDQTPRPGWLSNLGASWYGTVRRGRTYATTNLTVTNAGSAPATFKPYDLTIQRDTAGADGGFPSYRNTSDGAIYTNLDGSLTLAAGASVVLPVQAEQLGTYSDAAPGTLTVMVTGSFGTLTCTNAGPALGEERENPDDYRARCRAAASNQSPGGPGAAYRRAATTGVDGFPLQRFDGSGPVGITRVYVSADSTTGEVTVYYADADGGADAIDVSSANANVTGIALGVITDPIGVIPDAVTILPTATDPNTGGPGGAAATATAVGVAGTGRIKARLGGLSGAALRKAVQSAVYLALADYMSRVDIGGLDQTAGAGVVFTPDLAAVARDGYAGLYDVALTSPATPTTAIALGHVPTLAGGIAVTGAADNGAGLVRLTVASTATMTTGDACSVTGVTGTTEANGPWAFTVIDSTHVDLVGSAFVHAWVSGGTVLYFGVTVVA